MSLFMAGWRRGGEQSGHIVSNEDSDMLVMFDYVQNRDYKN